MRRYDDPIEVRHRHVAGPEGGGRGGERAGPGARGAGAGPAEGRHGDATGADGTDGADGTEPPESFFWRGRRYRIDAVLGHWYERTPWWRHGLEATAGSDGLILQEEIWRVEAAAIRGSQPAAAGVFDLARGCRWRLIRIAD